MLRTFGKSVGSAHKVLYLERPRLVLGSGKSRRRGLFPENEGGSRQRQENSDKRSESAFVDANRVNDTHREPRHEREQIKTVSVGEGVMNGASGWMFFLHKLHIAIIALLQYSCHSSRLYVF